MAIAASQPASAPPSSGLLTIADIAKRYELPESTARYYCKRFLDFLPHEGHGKRRRYRPEAIDVFDIILPEMRKRKDARAVEAVLEDAMPRLPEPRIAESARKTPPSADTHRYDAPPDVTTALEHQSEALHGIASALTRLAATQSDVKTLKEMMARQQSLIDSLRQEISHLKALQGQAEQTHQADLEQLRRTLSHLAGELAKSRGE